MLLSRFSDDWDRLGSNEPTIAFTRTRSSGRAPASAFIEKRSRGATDADDRDVAFPIVRSSELPRIEANRRRAATW